MDPPPHKFVSMPALADERFDNRLKIIVGLDYGTTNSGISYVTSDQKSADKIEVIREWPYGPGTIAKVPSAIAYKSENPDEGQDEDQWGFGAIGLKSYLWTKLLLGKDYRVGQSRGTNIKKIYGDGFCTFLEKHDELTFKVTPMEFWITVPAMWTDAAKTATIEAAQAAGFGSRTMDKIHIITEPEAAAISVIADGRQNGPQNVLICDCGGGTVDIVSYKVVLKDGQLAFEELLVGVGALCGATSIDRNFDDWMIRKFGEDFNKVDPEMRGPSSNFFRQFEVVKKSFTGPGHSRRIDVWPINMDTPKSAIYDKRNFTVRLQTSDMLELFDPPIDEITKLVDSQVEAAKTKGEHIHQVILVGGFGDSPYLFLRLKDWCSARNIKLSCPPSCQEAIVKGACIRGLAGLRPHKRLARRHYGYSCSLPFREGIDDEDDSWICKWDNTKWCGDRITWFLSKGDSIEDYKLQMFSGCSTFYEGSKELTRTKYIWNCGEEKQPDTSQHWSMTKVGEVQYELTNSEVKTGKSKLVDGNILYKICHKVEVDLFSDRGDLQFRVLFNDQLKVNATIKFDESYDMMEE